MKRSYSTDLSDPEWECLKPYVPPPSKRGRPRVHTTREILDAIFYVSKSGCAWRLLPHDFPPWESAKPIPEEVARTWAAEWAKEGRKVDWQKLMPTRGFVVLPKRWVVERTFSWLSQNRRMSKDYERLCASAEAFVCAAMIRLMVRILARDREFPNSFSRRLGE